MPDVGLEGTPLNTANAMRVTVRRTRRAYLAPTTHYANSFADPNLPRMGEREGERKQTEAHTNLLLRTSRSRSQSSSDQRR